MPEIDKATPRPWRIRENGEPYAGLIQGSPADRQKYGEFITNRNGLCQPKSRGSHNAELIVEAVNAFDTITAERDVLKAEIVRKNADIVWQAKLLESVRNPLACINDELEDEGDRVYFGSTNHADQFREIAKAVDGWGWDRIIDQASGRDLYAEMRELRSELATLTAENAALLNAATDAVAISDAALNACPVEQKRIDGKTKCPICGATADQTCFRAASADYRAIGLIRNALAKAKDAGK